MEALSESAASAEYPSKNVTHIFSSTNLFLEMKENKASWKRGLWLHLLSKNSTL